MEKGKLQTENGKSQNEVSVEEFGAYSRFDVPGHAPSKVGVSR